MRTAWLARKPSPAPVATTASSSTSAIGTSGTALRGTRGASASTVTIPDQAQALNSPEAAATGNRSAAGQADSAAPLSVSTAKVNATHPAVRSGGRYQCQPSRTAPWWMSRPIASTGGIAVKNSQDTGMTASPNSSPVHGTRSTALASVNRAPWRSSETAGGRAVLLGQARPTSNAVRAARKATMATASRPKPSQERW